MQSVGYRISGVSLSISDRDDNKSSPEGNRTPIYPLGEGCSIHWTTKPKSSCTTEQKHPIFAKVVILWESRAYLLSLTTLTCKKTPIPNSVFPNHFWKAGKAAPGHRFPTSEKHHIEHKIHHATPRWLLDQALICILMHISTYIFRNIDYYALFMQRNTFSMPFRPKNLGRDLKISRTCAKFSP